MVLYDEKGARFAQTPIDANESKHTEYNSQRKENFGSPALASEAIVRSHSAVVSSPDLNSLSNQVSRSHSRGLEDKGIMGYENNFQTPENQTSLSFSDDGLNYSQESNQHPKENIATFDLREQIQEMSSPCQGIEIFDIDDMYQQPIQKKEQEPLSFANDFLLPPAPHIDEQQNTDDLNYPLNYSNSFLNGSNLGTNLNVETPQVLPDANSFKPTPSTCFTDNVTKKNPQSSTSNKLKPNAQQDLQSLLDSLEPPVKKRRGRPLGSKNSYKRNQPSDQEKKGPKRKTVSQPQKMLDNHSGISLQSYPSTLPPYSQVSRFTQEQPGQVLQTNGYFPSQPVLPQQNGYAQQSLGFLPQHSGFPQHTPISQQSRQFFQQASNSKSAFSQVSSSQSSGFSQLLPNSQSANLSHEFSNSPNPNFSQQLSGYQTSNYSQRLPEFSQLSASLKSPPQYCEYLNQSTNVKPQGYGQQPDYNQHSQETKTNQKSNQPGSYLQPLPDYSDYIAKYSQPLADYAKQLEYYQNYPQFFEQPTYNGQVKQVQKFPRVVEDYNRTSTPNQAAFQNQRFPAQNQEISSQKQASLSKQQTYVQYQGYPDQSHQIPPQNQVPFQNQVPLQNQYKSAQNGQCLYGPNQHLGHNLQTPAQNQVPFPVPKPGKNYHPQYPVQADQFEQMKKVIQYDQMIGKHRHFANGEYPNYPNYFPNNSPFLLPNFHKAGLNHQTLPETCAPFYEPATIFRSWHAPETLRENYVNKFAKNNAQFPMDARFPSMINAAKLDAANFSPTNNATKLDAANFSPTNSAKKLDAANFSPTNIATKLDAANFSPTNSAKKLDADNFSTRNNATKMDTVNYSTANAYPFPKDSNGTNFSTNSSNFYKIDETQQTHNAGSLPIQQNSADSLNILETILNSMPPSNDEKKLVSFQNHSAMPPKKSLGKQIDQCIDISQETHVSPVPNYFQLPNGKRVLSITASSLDARSKSSAEIREESNAVVTETRDWILKSPAPLVIDCSESKQRKRKIFRTEYRPHKGIEFAVRRYRAKGFLTRSPCQKRVRLESDFDKDDQDDEDDNDDIDEDEEDNNSDESNLSQNDQNFQDENCEQKHSLKYTNGCTENSGRCEIHHQGLPDLQQIFVSELQKDNKLCNICH